MSQLEHDYCGSPRGPRQGPGPGGGTAPGLQIGTLIRLAAALGQIGSGPTRASDPEPLPCPGLIQQPRPGIPVLPSTGKQHVHERFEFLRDTTSLFLRQIHRLTSKAPKWTFTVKRKFRHCSEALFNPSPNPKDTERRNGQAISFGGEQGDSHRVR